MSATERQDPHWGTLRMANRGALDEYLGQATHALYSASQAANYQTEAGYPIQSPLGMLLGGLSQVVDSLIDQLTAEDEAAESEPA